MLHQEDNPLKIVPPAAQIRVTPQELADALARLEARKEAGQRHLDGTVPIGEAVEQLGLDATADELWQEVQAGRTQAINAPLQRRQQKRLRFTGAAAALTLLLTGLLTLRMTVPAPPPVPATTVSPTTPQAAPITLLADLLVGTANDKMVLISEVRENQPVLCGLTATDKGAAFASFAPAALSWTLIKHDGRLYVRGWIADMSDTALRSSTANIYPSKAGVPWGLHPVPVTLPLNGFQSNPGLTGDDLISASHIQPDAHFREKW